MIACMILHVAVAEQSLTRMKLAVLFRKTASVNAFTIAIGLLSIEYSKTAVRVITSHDVAESKFLLSAVNCLPTDTVY